MFFLPPTTTTLRPALGPPFPRHQPGIRAFPTFRLYHNSQLLDEIQGANMSAVEAAVQRHMASLPAAAFSGSGNSLGGGAGTFDIMVLWKCMNGRGC